MLESYLREQEQEAERLAMGEATGVPGTQALLEHDLLGAVAGLLTGGWWA